MSDTPTPTTTAAPSITPYGVQSTSDIATFTPFSAVDPSAFTGSVVTEHQTVVALTIPDAGLLLSVISIMLIAGFALVWKWLKRFIFS